MTSSGNTLTRARTYHWPVVAWGAAAVYAWFVGGLRSFTTAATVGVAVPALVMFGIAVFAPPPRKPAPRRVPLHGWLLWLVPILGFCALEIIDNWVFHSLDNHPTWSYLMDPVLEWRPARAVAVLLWLAAGWDLVRR